MLAVTEAAKSHLSTLLADAPADADTAVRFYRDEQELALKFDEPQEGDQTIEHEDRVVLVLDSELAELLDGKTLDTTETKEGTALALTG